MLDQCYCNGRKKSVDDGGSRPVVVAWARPLSSSERSSDDACKKSCLLSLGANYDAPKTRKCNAFMTIFTPDKWQILFAVVWTIYKIVIQK